MVICHKLVLKSVSYPKIVENTPILIEQSIACNVYTQHPLSYILLESLHSMDVIYANINVKNTGCVKII